MKVFTKKTLLVGFLVITATFNTYTMKRALKSPRPVLVEDQWDQQVGNVLLGESPIKTLWEEASFNDLPQEVLENIIQLLSLNQAAQSLEDSAKAINSLAQVDKKLNAIINNPDFCTYLIENLVRKFNTSEIVVCLALQTQAAKRRLESIFFDEFGHNGFNGICVLLNKTAKSFESTCKIIRSLVKVSDTLNQLINSPECCQVIIPFLAKTFEEDLFSVCKALQTEGANAFLINAVFEGLQNNSKQTILAMALAGVDPNLCDQQGLTPLMIIIKNKDKGALDDFIERYARLIPIDFNQKNANGETALMIAVKKNFFYGVKMIIDQQYMLVIAGHAIKKGIKVKDYLTITDNNGQTALMIAKKYGNRKRIVDLLEKAEKEERQNKEEDEEQKNIDDKMQQQYLMLSDLINEEINDQQHLVGLYQFHGSFSLSEQQEQLQQLKEKLAQQKELLGEKLLSLPLKTRVQQLLDLQKQLLQQRQFLYEVERQNSNEII